jgi:hypothetical protein
MNEHRRKVVYRISGMLAAHPGSLLVERPRRAADRAGAPSGRTTARTASRISSAISTITLKSSSIRCGIAIGRNALARDLDRSTAQAAAEGQRVTHQTVGQQRVQFGRAVRALNADVLRAGYARSSIAAL